VGSRSLAIGLTVALQKHHIHTTTSTTKSLDHHHETMEVHESSPNKHLLPSSQPNSHIHRITTVYKHPVHHTTTDTSIKLATRILRATQLFNKFPAFYRHYRNKKVEHKITIPSTMQLCLLITSQHVSTINGHLQVPDAKNVTLHLFSLCVAVFLVNVV
jgi:hypothetical protein